MLIFLMFWNGQSLMFIRQKDVLYIRKRLLYLILMWESLEVNIGLIESIDKGSQYCPFINKDLLRI
jgi:hypothetical protein